MKNSIYTLHYDELRAWLKTSRESKGMSLRDLGLVLGQHHSIVGKIEQGRRRIDLLEFIELCIAIDADPSEGIAMVTKSYEKRSRKL